MSRFVTVSLGLALLLALIEVPTMGQDRTTSVASDDPEMVGAIDRARSAIKQFFDAFAKPKKGQTAFLLKVPFTRGDRVEHIWLADLDFSGQKARGVIANEPEIEGLRFKQLVELDPASVTDWMYVEGMSRSLLNLRTE
jgi:uncharacterized protein YegJ (DUF2314 family)